MTLEFCSMSIERSRKLSSREETYTNVRRSQLILEGTYSFAR